MLSQIETPDEVCRPPGPAPARAAESLRKRALDVAVAAAVLLAVAPLLLLVAAAIRLESPGPSLFRQWRSGLGGRAFPILKFRSMRVLENGAEIAQATRGDARVTRVGAVIRALSIDELPQMINVLRGEMSLVGPRPHALGHDELWSATVPGYHERFRVRPGITGYAQVSGLRGEIASIEQLHARIAADHHYIATWSVRGDLAIMLRTIPLLFHDPRAY